MHFDFRNIMGDGKTAIITGELAKMVHILLNYCFLKDIRSTDWLEEPVSLLKVGV